MLVIFILIFLIILSALCFSGLQRRGAPVDKTKKQYIVFVCILLGFQSALRDLKVGADTIAYSDMYVRTYSTSWDTIFERIFNYYFEGNSMEFKDPCYNLVEKIFQLSGLDYRCFLFFIAIVFFTAFGYFLYKNLDSIPETCLSFLIYMLIFYDFFSVTGLRQTFVTSLCLWAFEFARRKKILLFILFVLIASTLHKSALLFLPAYFLLYFKYPKQLLFASIILLPVGFIFKNQIVIFATNFIGYEQYAKGFAGAGAYGYATLSILAALIILWQSSEIIKINKYVSGYISLFAISIVVIPALWVDPSIMRVVQYYSIFILVLFPLVIRTLDMGVIAKRQKGQIRNIIVPKCGLMYYSCMFFLLLYCVIRFAGYEYSFFFLN